MLASVVVSVRALAAHPIGVAKTAGYVHATLRLLIVVLLCMLFHPGQIVRDAMLRLLFTNRQPLVPSPVLLSRTCFDVI